MIPKAAVKEYIARQLESHIWMKRLTTREVDGAIADMRPRPNLWPGLRLNQKVGFLLGTTYPHFSFWKDMATGKTLLSLELLKYWYDLQVIDRALVFVVSDKAFPTWEKQIVEYDTGLPFIALDESKSIDKWHQLRSLKRGIVLLTYPGTVAMCTKTVRKNNGKNKWSLDKDACDELGQWAHGTVYDESTKAGHQGSLTFNIADHLRRFSTVRYNLAGRPFGRDPTLLRNQQFLVDDGDSFGETLGLFRSAFFTEKPNFWAQWSPKFVFKKSMQKELSRMAQHRSITYTADECVDMPKHQFLEESVKFSQEAEDYYRDIIDEAIAARGNFREMKNVFVRMRQIASGFIGLKDDETGEKVEIQFDENPKLDKLLDMADALPLDRKMVIFYEFTHSGRRIVEELREMGEQPVWLWSGTKNTREALRQFEHNPKRRFCAVQNRVGAYSLDELKVANYGVFFESPVPAIDRVQAEKRLIRPGQLHKVFWFDLIVKGSVERRIREFHHEGGSLFKALLRDPARVLNEWH